jgi:hypothetical protein
MRATIGSNSSWQPLVVELRNFNASMIFADGDSIEAIKVPRLHCTER